MKRLGLFPGRDVVNRRQTDSHSRREWSSGLEAPAGKGMCNGRSFVSECAICRAGTRHITGPLLAAILIEPQRPVSVL